VVESEQKAMKKSPSLRGGCCLKPTRQSRGAQRLKLSRLSEIATLLPVTRDDYAFAKPMIPEKILLIL